MIYLHTYEHEEKAKHFSKKILINNLAHYLGKSTEEINIQHNKNGKPQVEGLYFSVSHCRNTIIQIFSMNAEVGVDIEFNNPKRSFRKLAQRYFHPNEFKLLNKLPHKQSIDLFYNLWTAKEAVCKTHGGRLWYYLADNYLVKNIKITPVMNGTYLQHLNTLDHFSLCVASTKQIEKINNV